MRRTPRAHRTTGRVLLGAVLVALVGCATPPAGDAGAPPATTTEGTTVTDLPLLQVHSTGGFVLAGTDFRTVPELTVYRDGRTVSHGPQIAIYPPPALPNLRERDLAPDELRAIVAAARDAGLLEGAPDYGQPLVTDVPTTVVTLRAEGRTVVHEVPALGFGSPAAGDGTDAGPGPDDGADLGLSDAQVAARTALTGFLEAARERARAGDGERYEIPGFALRSVPVPAEPEPGADAAAAPPEDVLEDEVLPWPLDDVALADAQACAVVAGAAAQSLERSLAGASTAALFDQDGTRYEVWVRPLLPHEQDCDDVLRPGPA